MFFLLNSGGGYTDVGVKSMLYSELAWHVGRLRDKLTKENAEQAAAVEAMRLKMAKRR